MWKSIQCMFFWQESLKHLFQFSQSSPNCKADYFSPLLCSVVRYWSQIGKNHSLIEKLFNHPERSLKEGGKSRSEAFVFYLLYPQWLKITGKVAFKIKRAKRAKLTFWVDKSWLKMPKMVHSGLKTWSLLSNSLSWQVIFEIDKKDWWKMQKFKCDILSNFQTMCTVQTG